MVQYEEDSYVEEHVLPKHVRSIGGGPLAAAARGTNNAVRKVWNQQSEGMPPLRKLTSEGAVPVPKVGSKQSEGMPPLRPRFSPLTTVRSVAGRPQLHSVRLR